MLPPFVNAIPILEIIEKNGYEAYFVGGSVRDSIIGRRISDVDIATSAFPEELKKIFTNTVDLGIEHGTILVIYESIPYEITSFRSESEYSDFRRPDRVEFIRSLTEDLKRRDFTMNAIAMDRSGKLIDPFAGKEAILEKRIATVGDPAERFSEDALRMMRAVRFVSQLSFTIETNTFLSLKKLAPLLEKIAVERKLVEFEKILVGQNRQQALVLVTETGLHQYLPGMAQKETNLKTLSSCMLSALSLEEMWTLLIYHLNLNGDEVERFLRDWKVSVKKIKQCQNFLQWLRFRMDHQWDDTAAFHAGKEAMLAAERLLYSLSKEDTLSEAEVIEVFDSLPIKSRSELSVTGTDLLSWIEKEPGPWIKDNLRKIEEKVITRELVNSKGDIREWLIQCNPK